MKKNWLNIKDIILFKFLINIIILNIYNNDFNYYISTLLLISTSIYLLLKLKIPLLLKCGTLTTNTAFLRAKSGHKILLPNFSKIRE